jgi:hypothetical protein
VANTWTELTAHEVYAMVREGKECENPQISSVAATFEKAITYAFAGRLIRNAEVRGSTPLCSTIQLTSLQQISSLVVHLVQLAVWPKRGQK